jgi:hypothetical protein
MKPTSQEDPDWADVDVPPRFDKTTWDAIYDLLSAHGLKDFGYNKIYVSQIDPRW